MKLFLVALVLCSSFISFSTSAATVIAKARVAAGFSPLPCTEREVRVHSNGKVSVHKCNAPVVVIATLTKDIVADMIELSADLVPTKLEARDPHSPSCMDAPSTTYSVVNKAFETVAVGGNWGCKDVFYPENYAALRLMRVLTGLNDLTLLQ